MKYFFLLLNLLIVLPIPAICQSAFSGSVYDAQTQKPLTGVNVFSTDTSQVAVTDAKGSFSLNNLPLPVSIKLSLLGYQSQEIRVFQPGQALKVYLEPTSTSLSEVVVRGYENNRKLLETPGSIALLDKRELERFSNTSLVPAINTQPGVRMEERSPGSYRISIRGSTLRSPFGVRNVKIYWNDIPLTDPSGMTALNLIDFNTVGKIEIIKGPGGSLYGAGTGGVILLQSPKAGFGEQSLEAGGVVGSFGLRAYRAIARTGNSTENIVVTYANQQSAGYRAHSAMQREAVNVRAQFNSSQKRTVSFNGFYNQLFYETPLGLTASEFQQNPRQARPGATEQNASIALKALNLGLSQTYQFNERFSNVTAFYGTFTKSENPFTNNYKRLTEQGLGGRTRFVFAQDLGSVKSRYTLGGEFQTDFTAVQQYNNKQGKVDTLTFNDEITARLGFVFAQADFDLPHHFFLTLGGSYNRLIYQISRLTNAATNPNYTQNRTFKPVFSPRIALLKKLGQEVSVHGSVSFGYSPPTTDDIRTSDGSINTGLEAEKGVNYEVGLRGTALRKRLDIDLTLFSLQLSNTITTYTNAQGNALFRNAGNTLQNGLEVKSSFRVVESPTSVVRGLRIFANYTYNDFSFRNYVNNGNDISGNQLTGTPRHNFSAGLDIGSDAGLYTNMTMNYVSQLPLNDQNTVYARAYTLLGVRLGYRITLAKHLAVAAFVGVDNVLNQTYSLGNDLNAFGGRYYQPAAARNYYGGLTLGLKR